jgi:putative protease
MEQMVMYGQETATIEGGSGEGLAAIDGAYVGDVVHYYNRIGVAVLQIVEPIRVGDMLQIVGYSTDFRQRVTSLQIEHESVEEAIPGQDVAMKVEQRVRRQDKVFRIA